MNTVKIIVDKLKQATDFKINTKILKEKIAVDLCITHNGGLFQITPSLIAFLNSWESETVYLTDIYENPVLVDRVELLDKCRTTYAETMKTWHTQHEQLRRTRKV